jgi:CHAD domain-containing protein
MKHESPIHFDWAVLNRSLHAKSWNEAQRHDFRVALKRLRVLALLAEKHHYEGIDPWKALFKEVFHAHGALREVQVMQHLAKKFQVNISLETSAAHRKELEKQMVDWKTNFPLWQHWMEAELKSWDQRLLKKCVKDWYKDFCKDLQKKKTKDWHTLRRKAKRILYATEMIGKVNGIPVKTLKSFAQEAGEWHDLELFRILLNESKFARKRETLDAVEGGLNKKFKKLKTIGNQLA